MLVSIVRLSSNTLRRAISSERRSYAIDFSKREILVSAVPEHPIKRSDIIAKPSDYEITPETIHLLEKLSLVDISDKWV